MVMPDYVEKNAKFYPQKTAIKVIGDRSCTFSELQDRVYRLANGLLQMGVNKGDRVVVLAENCLEYPEMYFGIAKAGGVITPLNFRFAPPEVSFLTNESGAKVLIVQGKYVDMIKSLEPELKTVQKYICLGDAPEGMINHDALLAASPATNPGIDLGLEDLFYLAHTGGTTGLPKLTMLTYRNLYNCCLFWIIETGITYGDVYVVFSPLFHVGAAWPLFFNFMLGNTFLILQRFDVAEIAKTIEQERVSATMFMSQIVPLVVNHPDVAEKRRDLSSLRIVHVGAAVLPEPSLRRLLELFPGIRVTNAGGQTECGIFTSIRLEEHLDGPPQRLNSAGRAGIGMEIKIVDENDNELPPGEVGELCVRGEGVMKGYWNKPEETAVSLRGGWQHTGDLCQVDEEGYIYYVDRLKDMIKSGGENVYSKEVEDALYTHPAVQEAAVIGVPDDRWGEAVKALVVLRDGEKVTAEELIAHCRKYIAGYKCPKSVEFRDSFPKTALGKTDKPALRQPYWKGLQRKL
jgi:acyl-CoA synthetase (AMP-forming)/AMP-acid ligase II